MVISAANQKNTPIERQKNGIPYGPWNLCLYTTINPSVRAIAPVMSKTMRSTAFLLSGFDKITSETDTMIEPINTTVNFLRWSLKCLLSPCRVRKMVKWWISYKAFLSCHEKVTMFRVLLNQDNRSGSLYVGTRIPNSSSVSTNCPPVDLVSRYSNSI